MKLSYEDKLEIYSLKKSGVSWTQLETQFGVNLSNLKYTIRLMDRYGVEIVKKQKYQAYSSEMKQEMINKVLKGGKIANDQNMRFIKKSSQKSIRPHPYSNN
ncbi:hypothetical protein BOVMAS02_12090 [Streptococcus uberis]|nr:transposase [Streptococcus uberis 6736]SQG83869.1 transposase [Streptococcus uberis]SUO92268.1 transposase [Streptococcus uberis]